MRLIATGSTLLAAATAIAGEGMLGTKSDVLPASQPASSGVSLMPLLQMAVAVAIVMVLLKVWLPKVISKVNKGLKGSLHGGLSVEEAASFAGGTLNVVTVRGRTLLLSVGPQGVTFIADLTEPRASAEPQSFLDMVESAESRAARKPNEAISLESVGVQITNAATPPDPNSIDEDEIRAALNRAKLLTA